MDSAEPSSNGVSTSNLFRLSSLLEDQKYENLAKGTLMAFEAEIMQYPWLFSSFMPGIVAANLGVKGIVRVCGQQSGAKENSNLAQMPIGEGAPIDRKQGTVGGETTTARGLVEVGESFEKVIKSHVNTFRDQSIRNAEAHMSSNPAVLASQLQNVRLNDGAPLPKLKSRGALETRSYIDDKSGLGQWLKSRNNLIAEFKPSQSGDRVMICEGRSCKESEGAESEGWTGEFREW